MVCEREEEQKQQVERISQVAVDRCVREGEEEDERISSHKSQQKQQEVMIDRSVKRSSTVGYG
jgi:hypothetical protein